MGRPSWGKYIRSWWFWFTFFCCCFFSSSFFLFGFDFSECVCCRASCSPVGMRYAFHKGDNRIWGSDGSYFASPCSALFLLWKVGDSSFLGGLVCKSEMWVSGGSTSHTSCAFAPVCPYPQALLALILPHHSLHLYKNSFHTLLDWMMLFFVVVYCMFLPL